MIRAVIVDDESAVRKVIRALLVKLCPEVEIVGEANSVDTAYQTIVNTKPDLVLLDIQMPGGNGFTILKKLDQINFKTIFITAFDQYAIEAIKFNALDYLLKPINSTDLTAAISRFKKTGGEALQIKSLLENINSTKAVTKIAIPSTSKITYVNFDQIVRIQAEGSYTDIFLQSGVKILSSKAIKEYEDILKNKDFFRVHRSHLINLNLVAEFSTRGKDLAIMSDGSKVEVSRNHRSNFKEAMGNI